MRGFTGFFKIGNFVGFQVGWWACALGARDPRPYGVLVMGIVVLLHLLSPLAAGRRLAELRLLLLAGVLGVVLDGALLHGGALRFPGAPGPVPPLWMVALWVGFATTLNGSLRWLAGRPLVAAALGALAGPLSYRAGVALGALEVRSYGAVALEWSVAMVLLLWLAQRAAGDTAAWRGLRGA